MFEAELHADAVFLRQCEHGLDAFCLRLVIDTATLVLHIEEAVADPDANIVAAIGGKFLKPRLHATQSAGLVAALRVRPDHVQPDGHVGLAVGEFEVARIARADPHETFHRRIRRARGQRAAHEDNRQ
ncbi:MAG: hypothetical protein NTY53_06355 [Kiritimatiellaeota bacterium]|nr:hypothetical protein [Kiritimatiellota bacterium]